MHKQFSLFLSVTLFCFCGGAAAQVTCVDTPQGKICTIQQPIVAGSIVSTELQKALGLITIAVPGGSCSGTLLNRWWVLTARHCITTNGGPSGPPSAPSQVQITATWAPAITAKAVRIYDFVVNTGPGVIPARDIVLVYHQTDLGEFNLQFPYVTDPTAKPENWVGVRLTQADNVNQYGRGLSTLASPGPPPVQAGGGGTYRTGVFTSSNISETQYDLAMNAANQIGHAGDSGGPTVITKPDGSVFIAGVQSTCNFNFLANSPGGLSWATRINFCTYISVEPLVQEIGRVIQETPIPGAMAAIAQYVETEKNWRPPPMSPILQYLLQQ